MPLPTFTSKTDNVDIIHAADVNNLQNEVAPTAAATPAARYSTAYTSTASITLTDSSYPVQSVSPSAARTIALPAVSTANHAFFVINRSTVNAMTVNNAAAAFVAYVRPSGAGIILPDSTAGWYGISLPKFSTSTSPTNFLREDGTLAAVAESNVTFTDVTTNNASTSAHGYLKKLSGTATEFMNGAGNWATPTATSTIIQIVATQNAAETHGSTVIPKDDTVPTSSEGFAVSALDTAITPTNSSNILEIDVILQVSASAASYVAAALFQDAGAAALATCGAVVGAAYGQTLVIRYRMTAGTTSATTFKVRAGPEVGTTVLTINGQTSARLFGGTFYSSMKITEIKV